MAVALVVLDSNFLVDSMVNYRLEMVACLVAMVGLGLVDIPLDFLDILVADCIQRSDNLDLEEKVIFDPKKQVKLQRLLLKNPERNR